MNNLRKFTTESEYTAATLNYPSVAWVTSTDVVHFDKTAPTPTTFSGLTVYYNISDTSEPTTLFNGGGSGSGSGSGSGGALPSSMIIDGTEVEVTNAYQFSTTGEHIVNYSFAENQIPDNFLVDENTGKFSTVAKVEIGDAITSIGDSAFFQCINLTSVTIPNSVTSIGNVAFQDCTSLTSVMIPSGLTVLNPCVFQNCTSLTSITIPNSVMTIGDSAFLDCSGLTSVIIPSGITSIAQAAFYGCSSLTSCTIGSGVTSIGREAFSSCYSLISITSNAMVAPTLGYNTFDGINNNGVLTVPSGSQGYCGWMLNLPSYWTIEGVTCDE